MRFKCCIRYPRDKSPLQPGVVGFAAETTQEIAAMCDRLAAGTQCNGGVMSLTVLDRQEGSSLQVQRRSCHGFGKMVAVALQALDDEHTPPVPVGMGEDARMEILGTSRHAL